MLWVGGNDVISGRITAGELAAFIFYAFIVAGSVGAISEVYTDLQRAAGATERLMELLHSPSELTEPAHPVALPPQGRGHLEVRDVDFRYPLRRGHPVLSGVGFTVDPGEMVAVVGPSGAGKSTLFDLIQRFYDPTGGSVLLDGVDLRSLALAELRRHIGYVPQEAVLFAGTVADNVRYGNPAAAEAEIVEALRLAHAEAFVQAFPDGLQTWIGEGGTGLSGGQKQRLAIARALLPQPRLLLLDEATSALDAESEQRIRESMEALKGRCSVIAIAHRLSTVRQADRILVLEDGRLVASGDHDALMRGNELYARFARIQFTDAPSASGPPDSATWRSTAR
jgi:ATP-binding cassette subfamily B protein